MALAENLFLKRMWLTFIGDLIIRIDLYLETHFFMNGQQSYNFQHSCICNQYIELSPQFLIEVWIENKNT